jgi:hypothetical protein
VQIRTAGELRGFLASIMVGVRDGKVECGQAAAISKIAAQINQSLAVEVNTALQLEKMGKDRPVAGSMLIGSLRDDPDVPPPLALETDQDGLIWCDQCDGRVSPDDAAGCKSRHCSLKAKPA